MTGFEDDSIEEATISLAKILTEPRDKFRYVYDFGDDWTHQITLEAVTALDADVDLPRCTGGRGAAPIEDCGGVWGWAALVAATNDPGHERQQ